MADNLPAVEGRYLRSLWRQEKLSLCAADDDSKAGRISVDARAYPSGAPDPMAILRPTSIRRRRSRLEIRVGFSSVMPRRASSPRKHYVFLGCKK